MSQRKNPSHQFEFCKKTTPSYKMTLMMAIIGFQKLHSLLYQSQNRHRKNCYMRGVVS